MPPVLPTGAPSTRTSSKYDRTSSLASCNVSVKLDTTRTPCSHAHKTQDTSVRLRTFDVESQLVDGKVHRIEQIEPQESRARRVNSFIAAVDHLIPRGVHVAPCQRQADDQKPAGSSRRRRSILRRPRRQLLTGRNIRRSHGRMLKFIYLAYVMMALLYETALYGRGDPW
ncbi:hypothetical protein LZ30DRAFT_251218 [Colletotrichum cereale]|nr:hypothetical protein LZ30DRAFT_251218 [Colletotrichum cereale]